MKNRTANKEKPADQDAAQYWINIVAVFPLLALLFILGPLFNQNILNPKISDFDRLPVSIQAESEADYSRQSRAYSIPPISGSILKQIITQFPATGSPYDRMGTLQAALSTPVPTMTPNRRLPATSIPTLARPKPTQATDSPAATAIATLLPPTAFPPPPTALPTAAPTVPATLQPMPTATVMAPRPTQKPQEPKPTKESKEPKPPKEPKEPKPRKKINDLGFLIQRLSWQPDLRFAANSFHPAHQLTSQNMC